jgi:hypothetical protein
MVGVVVGPARWINGVAPHLVTLGIERLGERRLARPIHHGIANLEV